jgi:hypothetical protein
MGSLYRFSPVKNETDLDQVWSYITTELDKLSKEVFNQKLPITTLKIFAHYQEEYDYLHRLISKLGPEAPFNSKTSFYAQVDRKICGTDIKYLGVRIVDPYRLQVGCGDFEVGNFKNLKTENVNKSAFVRTFREDMLEIWHPDYDILGYVVSPFIVDVS